MEKSYVFSGELHSENDGGHLCEAEACLPVYLSSEADARIAELEKALYALVTSHNGYRHGVGPCICAAHEEARKVLGITRGDETPQSLMER